MIKNEPQITPDLVASHGLKPDEYERIPVSYTHLTLPTILRV